MKMKLIYIVCSAIAAFAITTFSYAQDAKKQSYKGEITITPLDLRQRGDSLYVNIDFKMNGVNVESRLSSDFIPVLVAPSDTMSLPKVSVKGRDNYKNYNRSLALMSKKQKEDYMKDAPYSVIKGYNNNNDTLKYRYVLPFEPWMADARLDMQKDACGCGNVNMLDMQRLVNNVSLEKIIILEPYEITPSLAYVQPVVESVKLRDVQTKASLDFAVGKFDIRYDYMNNSYELEKINKMIDELKSDDNINIKKIEIIGYASPEGSLSTNKRLAEQRATALKKYLSARYDFSKDYYSIRFGGENWDGLVEELELGYYSYKDEVLSIINEKSIEEGREKAIMDLNKGVPYRHMLKEIFPRLRVAICKVDYNVRNFNDPEEAARVYMVSPQNLSLNEMYMVANRYEVGSMEYNDVFETAARLYPKDETAALNAATAALSRNDLTTAERYLDKIKSKIRIPEYDNTLGVLYMLKGEYETAQTFFTAANEAGLSQAQDNLNEIDKKLENMKLIDEYKKK